MKVFITRYVNYKKNILSIFWSALIITALGQGSATFFMAAARLYFLGFFLEIKVHRKNTPKLIYYTFLWVNKWPIKSGGHTEKHLEGHIERAGGCLPLRQATHDLAAIHSFTPQKGKKHEIRSSTVTCGKFVFTYCNCDCSVLYLRNRVLIFCYHPVESCKWTKKPNPRPCIFTI